MAHIYDKTERLIRPDRYRNAIVPHIYVDGAADGTAFYQRAFGAVELFRMAHPDGKILHAEISIAGSVVMIGDPDDRLYSEPRSLWRSTASLHVFSDDNAALQRRAVEAGAEEIQPPTPHSAAQEFLSAMFHLGKIEIRPVWRTWRRRA